MVLHGFSLDAFACVFCLLPGKGALRWLLEEPLPEAAREYSPWERRKENGSLNVHK